ncbi:MAG: hypothetical protein E6Q75_00825 [Rheinheimera sp.]|nr:MAG: hypothetical protein E6Q75_00825 [Rheinheimera sp.]
MQERSGIQTNKPTLSLDSEHGVTPQSSRRKFLTKASVGIVVASLPARSVWARDGGVAQSIVASGHGSDFADGKKIALLSPGYWKNHCQGVYHSYNFKTVFNGLAFAKTSGKYLDDSTTFGDILKSKGAEFKGPGNINFHLIAMYLNALNHGQFGLYYPVGQGKPFSSPGAFAQHIYDKAKSISPQKVGEELAAIIKTYHVAGKIYDDGSGKGKCENS